MNVDIHPGIEGSVTINAIDQTLKQILTRISKQVDMRYEIDGQTIHVMPDSPFLRNYRVDYVNMARDTTETVAISTQVISGADRGAAGTDGQRRRQQLDAADQQHLAQPLLGNPREEHQGHAARDRQAPAGGQQRDLRERARPDGHRDHAVAALQRRAATGTTAAARRRRGRRDRAHAGQTADPAGLGVRGVSASPSARPPRSS